MVSDCGARVVVTDDRYAEAVGAMASVGVTAQFASVDGGLPGDFAALPPMPAAWAGCNPGVPRLPTGAMCIYYTSGTTGRPKGAIVRYSKVHFATLN